MMGMEVRDRVMHGEGAVIGASAGPHSYGQRVVGAQILRGRKVPVHTVELRGGPHGAVLATIPAQTGLAVALDVSHPSGVWVEMPGYPDYVSVLFLYEAPGA
jgi:hypothetical protein